MEPIAPTVDLSLQGEFLEAVSAIASPEDWQTWLQTWLAYLAPDLSPIHAYELSIQFTSDAAIATFNAQYRQRDRPTDVLSFAALENAALPPEVLQQIPCDLGDLIISVETARRQSDIHGHTLLEEIAWLAAHGLLHLLGWDHPDETRLEAMLSMQQKLLAQVGLKLSSSTYFAGEIVT
ncbi:MAG: rRNA maturation RNase YbeY [Cyanobacteria bacterium J06626_18]